MGSKRRRIALSCVDCRRRKVKCDRTMPACERCQKGGIADKCIYVPYEGEESSPQRALYGHTAREGSTLSWADEVEDYARIASGGPASTIPQHSLAPKKPSQAELISKLEGKVAELEAHMEASRSNPAVFAQGFLGMPTPASTIHMINEPPSKAMTADIEQVLMRGKSFKTQYYGPSHYASILLQFDELSTFIKDIVNYFPAATGMVKNTQDDFKLIRRELEKALSKLSHEHSALLEMLPDQPTCEILIRQYMESFETTYRVLHVPTFRRQLEEFWRDPTESPTSFVVVLLLAMASVYCVNPQEQPSFIGRSSQVRERATRWVAACESWLRVQSHKHATLVIYQVRILLFLAKRMNAIKIKRAWMSSGDLIRHAMAAGLHREPPAMSAKISIFDQEMRRRLWFTMLELELLAAIDKGMPAAVSSVDWDCQPPSNIHDEEFDENTTGYLPPARPYSEFTRTAYLCVSSASAPLRIEMLSTINRLKSSTTLELAAQFDIRTRQALADIPFWSDAPGPDSQHQPSPRLAKTLAKLQLMEFTILTYQPFASSNSKSDLGRAFFSRAAFRDAAAGILELYQSLAKTEDLTLRFCRNDAFRAGLCVCYDICTTADSFGSSVTFNRNRAIELLEHALTIQEARVLSLGQGFHPFWITSSALSLAYAKQSQSQFPHNGEIKRDKYAQEAASRVTRINEKMVALQQPQQNGVSGEEVGEMLLDEARAVLAKGDGMPSGLDPDATAGGAGGGFLGGPELNFDVFNIADVWNLDGIYDFGYI